MKLERLTIEDYKSIKKLDWNLNEPLTCLVGQNESGKSNLIELFNVLRFKEIENLDISSVVNRSSDRFISGDVPLIRAEYSMNKKERKKLIERLSPYNKDSDHLAEINLYEKLIIQSEKKIETDSFIYFENEEGMTDFDQYVPNPGQMPACKDILDSLRTEIVELHDDYIDQFESTVNELKGNPESTSSLAKLLRIAGAKDFSSLETDPIKLKRYLNALTRKLNREFTKKYYSQDKSVELRIMNDGIRIYLEIYDESEAEYAIHERSAGFQYFFGLIIELATIADIKKDVIFILDEPGAKLHPSGQRDLLKYLEGLSQKYRIIYTTHSPFLINRLYPNRVKVIEKNKSKGTIFKFKGFSKNWYPLRSSLGLSLSDSFYYSEKALLVEGPEDVVFISSMMNLIHNNGIVDINTDIFSFIDSGGESNLPAMVQIMIDDERPLMVLIDSDSPKTFKRLKEKASKLKSGMLVLNQINEFDSNAISIEDLLPKELLLKAFNSYLKELVDDGVLSPKKGYIELTKDLPESEIYKSVFRPFIVENYTSESKNGEDWKKEKVPISKVGIARHFEKLIEQIDFSKYTNEFKPMIRLIKVIIDKLKLKVT